MKIEFLHVPEGRSRTIEEPYIQVRYGEMVGGDEGDVIAYVDHNGLWVFEDHTYTDFICS